MSIPCASCATVPRQRTRNVASSSSIPGLCRVLAVSLFALLATSPARTQSPEKTIGLPEHTPPQVLDGSAIRIGHYNPSQMLRLAIAVTPPHMAEEEQFIHDVTTPNSPIFHQFLSADEWNTRFAPSAEDEQSIVDWAKSQGLTVTARFPNRLDVDLEATAGVIEKAFGVTINSYRVGDEVDFSNDRDPVLPASIAGHVTAVLGLNNIQRMHGSLRGVDDDKGPDYTPGPVYREAGAVQRDGDASKLPVENMLETSNYTNGYYDPSDLYSAGAYDFNALKNLGHCCNPHNDSGGSPPDSSIAIAAYGNVNPTDILGFHNAYPYLAVDVNIIQIDGQITCTPKPPATTCYNYSGETSLDTEWALATSNSFGAGTNTAHIYTYEGNNGFGSLYDIYNAILKANNTRISSTSWSCTEIYGCSTSFMGGAHNIFNNLVGQGWTLIAASGDRGATDDCTHTSVSFPGSDPDFVSAGGTTMNLAYPTDNFSAEVAWQGGTAAKSCSNNGGGSGGGISAYYSKPSWQNSFGGSARLVPDISLNASIGQNYYFNGGLYGVGGTSIVDPELAGFFAQENSYLAYIGSICGSNHASACTPIGAPNPVLYYEGENNYSQHNPYYDITSGCNSNDITAAGHLTYYCAHTGYDLVTGWGAFNALQLAWSLNWGVLNNFANGIPYVNFTGAATGHWYNSGVAVYWTVVDYDGNVTNPHHTGIAGFTQGWDSIPADPALGSRTSTGNSYFAGPQFTNVTNGCLALVNGSGGCSGGVSQGCHTAHVRGWNNEGWTTGDSTYGPLCYDTIAPTTAKSTKLSGLSSVQVTLSASDPGQSNGTGSGVAHTYYSVDNSSCTTSAASNCTVYKSPFVISKAGTHTVRYFSVDVAGNSETEHSATVIVR